MQKRDSLLQLFVKWGLHEDFPRLAERLAVEDVVIPDLRRTIQLAEILDEDRQQQKGRYSLRDKISRASAAVPEALEKSPKAPQRALSNVRRYLKNKFITPGVPELPPAVIRKNYEGLTDIEAAFAYSMFAPSAKVAGKECYPEMDDWLKELCEKGNVPPPRLIIVDSDLPVAAAGIMPDEEPVIIVTTNLMEILNDRQIKAVMAHELRHVRERGNRGLISTILHGLHEQRYHMEPRIREEYRADAFSSKLTGSADDLVDALLITQERMSKIKQFAEKMNDVFDDQHIMRWSALPPQFNEISRIAHIAMRLLPERNSMEYRHNNRTDPHPPLLSRFDRMYDLEKAREERKR